MSKRPPNDRAKRAADAYQAALDSGRERSMHEIAVSFGAGRAQVLRELDIRGERRRFVGGRVADPYHSWVKTRTAADLIKLYPRVTEYSAAKRLGVSRESVRYAFWQRYRRPEMVGADQ